jgi:putative PIN family toxin of toxin-antitoxin system
LLWGGTPFRLIQAATDGNVTLYTSPALLAEPRAVLGRAHLAVRLRRQNASVEEAMTPYGALAINVSPTALPRVVAADADDDQVVAAAVAAKADLIVSGDRHLLDLGSHQGIRITTPIVAVRLLGGH